MPLPRALLLLLALFAALAAMPAVAAAAAPACTIKGTTGDDELDGTPGADVICGFAGNDTINGLGGNDTINAGYGNDTVDGGYGNDAIDGSWGNDSLNGNYGNDSLSGYYGDDAVNGSYGDDTVGGGAGTDVLNPSFGNDTASGGTGSDTVTFPAATGPVTVGLGAGTASGQGTDGLSGIEHAIGGRYGDTLNGTSGPNALDGGAGNDTVAGFSGDDTLKGGDGKDTLTGSYGNDGMAGGAGDDDLSGGVGDDALDGGPGADRLHGGAGSNTCTGGGGADVLDKTCDGTPPVLAELSRTPDTVDTSQAAREITFTARVTDDLSGTAAVSVQLRDPNGEGTAYGELERQTGSGLDGVYEGTVTLPRYSLQGDWTVEYLYVADAANNTDFVVRDELETAGFETVVTQKGPDDSAAPALVDFDLAPATIDTNPASQDVTFTAELTDDLAGVAGVEVQLRSPKSAATVSATLTRQSGSALNGVYTGTATFPRYAHQGTWTIDELYVSDEAGNNESFTGAELDAAGFPDAVAQTGADDAAPPAVVDFSFTPQQVDVSSSSQTVTFTAELSDQLAGVAPAATAVRLRAPNGISIDATLTRQSGDAFNGLYSGTMTIPKFSVQGEWTVEYLYVADEAYNYYFHSTADLDDAGFDTTVKVGP